MSPKISLPKDVARVLEAILYYLVPETMSEAYQGLPEYVLIQSGRLLREFQSLYRFGFFLGVRLFNYLPFVFGYGFHRFTALSPTLQVKYAESWAASHIAFKREFFQGLKGLVLVSCFSHEKIWKEIDYDPKPHLIERIQMRQNLIKSGEKLP